MAVGGGWSSRGDVVHGKDDDESRRKIPRRIAFTAASGLNLITVLIYMIAWANNAQGWWNEYEPNAWVSPVRALWRRWAHVIEMTGAWGSPQMFKRLIPLAVEWIACILLLFLFDQVPRLVYAEGLVPYGQASPADGLRTSWGWLFARVGTVLERVVEKPHFVRVNTPATRRAKRRNEEKADTTPAWVVEAYRVIVALWGEETLTREAFKRKLGRGGTRLYYKYVKGTRNDRAWFQQWGVIEQADNRGAWRWSKALNEVLAVDPELARYAQSQSPAPPVLMS